MKKVLVLILFLAFQSRLEAQEAADGAFGALSGIKDRISRLMEDNAGLRAEYTELYNEYQNLQTNSFRHASEIENFKQNSENIQHARRGQKDKLTALEEDAQKVQADILLNETKAAFLKSNLMNMDDKQRLLKLQFADLEYQKRELEMELQLKTIAAQDKAAQYDKELQALKLQLQINLEKEAQLTHAISDFKSTAVAVPERAERLEGENRELEDQIAELERKLDFKLRETDLLKNKRELGVKLMENGTFFKGKRKEDLEQKVAALEAQYNDFSQKMETSLTGQTKRKALMQSVIDIDKENQGLRDKIAELTEKIEKLAF